MYREKGQVHTSEIVKQEDVCLPVDATFRQLLGKMNDNTLGAIVILKNDRSVGIVTERDVVQMIYDNVKLDDGIYAHAQKKLTDHGQSTYH